MGYEATKSRFTPGEYLIGPADLLTWARGLRTRDAIGLALMVAAAAGVSLWLQDFGAGLFAAGLLMAMWWHLDSRWALGGALVLLVLIPVMQLLYDRNWLYSGAALASGLAVAVWYLLAIGVVRAVAELRTAPRTQPAAITPASPPTSEVVSRPTSPRAAKPIDLRTANRHPEARVPSWRRRLAAIEADTRTEPSRRSLDGVRGRRT